jgi:hypothetical protein
MRSKRFIACFLFSLATTMAVSSAIAENCRAGKGLKEPVFRRTRISLSRGARVKTCAGAPNCPAHVIPHLRRSTRTDARR